MNTPINQSGKPSIQHPLMIAAAIAIILFCLAGTAAIMGWIPSSIGGAAATSELSPSDRAALASRLADSDTPMAGMQLAAAPMAAPLAPMAAQDTDTERDRARALQQERDRELAQRERDQAARERRQDAQYANATRERAPVRLAANTPAPKPRATCSNCGNVESVRAIKTRAQGSGLGAAGGAVLGGLLGNQIGGGNGRKLATVAGAVGGAVVGNQVEGNMKATTSYEVRVRLDNGTHRTFNLQNQNGFSSGDRIKVVNGALRHAG